MRTSLARCTLEPSTVPTAMSPREAAGTLERLSVPAMTAPSRSSTYVSLNTPRLALPMHER